jgi:hypothetical protein
MPLTPSLHYFYNDTKMHRKFKHYFYYASKTQKKIEHYFYYASKMQKKIEHYFYYAREMSACKGLNGSNVSFLCAFRRHYFCFVPVRQRKEAHLEKNALPICLIS